MARKRRSHRPPYGDKKRLRMDPEVNGYEQAYISRMEVGFIKRVKLTNFMCHAELNFQFDKNITVITGLNGSGKSAILAALMVCLGAKSSDIGRGENLKSFIKRGHPSAQIETELRNEGSDSFKPKEYGKSIVVLRKICLNGTSSYTLKSSEGNVIGTKKNDLLTVLEHFNIQVNNPLTMLTQMKSRKFLKSEKPSNIYRFFEKATQLDQIRKSVADSEGKLCECEERLKREEEELPEVDHFRARWETVRNKLRYRQELYEKEELLTGQLAWSLTIEKEREYNEIKHELQSKEKKGKNLEIEITKTTQSLEAKMSECSDLGNQLRTLENDKKETENDTADILEKIKDEKVKRREKDCEKWKTESKLKSAQMEERASKREIEAVESELRGDCSERECRNKEVFLLQKKLEELEATVTSKLNHLNKLNISIQECNKEITDHRSEYGSMKNQLESYNQKMQNLESSCRNKLWRYGQHIPVLLEKIARGKFHKKPLGPIADLISLREDKWALAIESCLSNFLEAFCCDNHHDEMVLKQLINATITNGAKPTTIVGSFQNSVYDVRVNSVNCPPHPSILDMLKFSDPAIANALIDHKNIESILLIEDKTEARRIMTYSVPKNCRQCFTIEGDQIFGSPTFRNYSNSQKSVRYLQGSADDRIEEFKKKCKQLNDCCLEKQHSLNSKESDLNVYKQDSLETKVEVDNLIQQIAHVRSDYDKHVNFVEPEPVDVSSVKISMQRSQDNCARLAQQIKDLEEAIGESCSSQQSYESCVKENDEKIKTLVNQSEILKERINEIGESISFIKDQKQSLIACLEDCEKEIEELKEKFENTDKDVQSMIQKVKAKYDDHFRTDRSQSSIYLERKQIKNVLEKGRGPSVDEMEVACKSYKKAKAKYENMQKRLVEYKDLVTRIKNGLKIRRNKFEVLRNQLGIRIKHLFPIWLERIFRNYAFLKGKINFNHIQKALTFEMEYDMKAKHSDLNSLSGGEGSIATICFLASLWDTIESPIYILDEFDVFLDDCNRKRVMEAVIESAKLNPNKQFIFFTPQTWSEDDASVNIYCMPRPVRSLLDK